MENAVDKNFDRLEIWTLRNVLCLPRGEEELVNWVRLGHYEVSLCLNAAVDMLVDNVRPENRDNIQRSKTYTRSSASFAAQTG